MPSNLEQILKLDVPVIVRLAERQLPLGEVLRLVPGAIIELDKDAEGELDLMVNNRAVASGTAVKVGENFGIRLTYMGDPKKRVHVDVDQDSAGDEEAARLADAILAGQ
jgi:flagellar motor switch protein FliN/FliY